MNRIEAKTLMEMLSENAERLPHKVAMIYHDQQISYRTLYRKTNSLANFLIRIGLDRGDRVGLMMNKTPEVVISFLGVASACGAAMPIDFNLPAAQLQYLVDLTEVRVIIISDEHQHLLSGLHFPSNYIGTIVVGSPVSKSDFEWVRVIEDTDHRPPGISAGINDVAYLNLTSGTTGLSKCAVTTHANIFWNTAAAVQTLNLTPDDVHLCLFAVFAHPHELVARPLYLGGTLVLLDKIAPKTICRTISEHGVTCMMAIASVYQTLVRLYEATPFDLSPLRLPESGGMHTPPVLLKEFEERFQRRIIPVWGSTEATGIGLAMAPGGQYKPGSVGTPCPTYEMRIIDDNGIDVIMGEVGEMIIRGPGVISSYYGNPGETMKCLKDGWLYTGDMFKSDSDGYFYFAGRRQGMMKVAGMKVYPVEIEETLLSHPGISEAVVVKHLDELHGEVPRAIIVLKPDVSLDKRDIRQFCEQRIAKCKVPRVIEFRPELPKTSGGKIRWREL